MAGHDVYLVGSVPMASAQEVFETVSAALGPRIKRLPDGETGERGDWITWLEPVFADNPAFREVRRVLPRARDRNRARALHAQARPRAAGRALRQSVLCRHRQGVLRGVQAAQGCRQDRGRHQVPGRSGAGAFGDLALSGRRAACADRPDLQRGGQARDRQDRSRDPARRAGDPVRRRVRGVRAARAQRGEQLRPQQGGDAGDVQQHPGRPRQPRAGGHRSALPPLLRRFEPQARGRADRHGRHGRVRQPRVARRSSGRSSSSTCRCRATAPTTPISSRCKRLKLRPETELCLGLVHHTDGVEGTKTRLATARKYATTFSVGTECGFGRRDPKTIPELLRIHAEVADLD